MDRIVRILLSVVAVGLTFDVYAESEAHNPLVPASVTWGGYNGNNQLADSANQWPFVQKNMDGFLMHGAYWLILGKGDQYDRNLKALGEILKKNGKTADVESPVGESQSFSPADPAKREGIRRAKSDLLRFQEFAKNGIAVNKVRVDWFPLWAMAACATKFGVQETSALLEMVTGADTLGGKLPPGFDLKCASWVDYGLTMNQAYPDLKISFDQALCNHRPVDDPAIRKALPWPGFGYGYDKVLTFQDGANALVNGKPVTVRLDFADLLHGVILGSQKFGINFIGFEGDTPYNYISDNLPGFPKEKLVDYLLAVERFLHANGLHSGRIINDSGASRYGGSEWIQVDLGSPVDVERVRVIWGKDSATEALVQIGLDEKNWQNLSLPFSAGLQTSDVKFRSRVARFVRIKLLKKASSRACQIAEIEIYGPSAPKGNLALGRMVTASGVSKSHPSEGQKAGKGIVEVVDGKPQTFWESDAIPNDVWDKTFHDRSMEYLEFYQSAGGRSDQYIVESWYEGPFTYFPETKDGTFSNLARDVIRRIKGLNDDGSAMKVLLDVHARSASGNASDVSGPVDCRLKPGEVKTFEILVRNEATAVNKGDARCTPLVRVDDPIPAGYTMSFEVSGGRDITDQVFARQSFDGFFVGGLEPGEATPVIMKISRAAATPIAPANSNDGFFTSLWKKLFASPKPIPQEPQVRFDVKVYWNPQDPKAEPRDKKTFLL